MSAARPVSAAQPVSAADLAVLQRQLGRPARAVLAVSYRCPCGDPAVVQTHPRLDDGTPFPTLYYLTCPRLCSAVSRLEATGAMHEMTQRLSVDPALAEAYKRAHVS